MSGIWQDRFIKRTHEKAGELAERYNVHNYRLHPDQQKAITEGSLDKLGWIGAVKVAEGPGLLFDGHLRVKIALLKGGPEALVPVDWYNLDEEETNQALLLHDTTTGMAETDWEALTTLIDITPGLEIPEFSEWVSGILERVADSLLAGDGSTPQDVAPKIDQAAELQKKWGTALGQVWQLGEHRIVCGDCTDPATVEAVMRGEKAEALITDLPYGSTGKPWDNVIDFEIMWKVYQENSVGDSVFITTSSQPFTSALISGCFEWFKHSWVWNKKLSGNFLQAERQPMKIHEDVCVFSRGNCPYYPQMTKGVKRVKGGNGRSKLWDMNLSFSVNDDYYPVSILEFPNTDRAGKLHPTEKPVELFCYLVGTYTRRSDFVLDITMGSGTTLIACENLGRKCRGIEIDPGYLAVTLQRWADLTGRDPIRLSE